MKKRVAIIFGGKSAEHEVSIQSAKNVYNSLDKEKYDVTLIGIDKAGNWHTFPDAFLSKTSTSYQNELHESGEQLTLIIKEGTGLLVSNGKELHIDVAIPVLHGPYGEDGSMQGYLKVQGIPFVGSGVLGSAIGMDKDVAKRLLRDAGIPVSKFIVNHAGDEISFENIRKELGLPIFIKAANMGSSIGVIKVHKEEEFAGALKEAFLYDNKVVIEEFIRCREIECAVLGNTDPKSSIVGEIIPHHEFYDYSAKYLDDNGAELKIPADLPDEKIEEIRLLALKTFRALCLEGMARVDMFLAQDGKVYVNEVNTIPGFTNISMYPKLWEASGVTYKELIDKLIDLAIERFTREKQIKSSI